MFFPGSFHPCSEHLGWHKAENRPLFLVWALLSGGKEEHCGFGTVPGFGSLFRCSAVCKMGLLQPTGLEDVPAYRLQNTHSRREDCGLTAAELPLPCGSKVELSPWASLGNKRVRANKRSVSNLLFWRKC